MSIKTNMSIDKHIEIAKHREQQGRAEPSIAENKKA